MTISKKEVVHKLLDGSETGLGIGGAFGSKSIQYVQLKLERCETSITLPQVA